MSKSKKTAAEEVVISGDVVTIHHPVLLRDLLKSPDKTLKILSDTLSPITLDDLDIDPSGKLVVNNPAFSVRMSRLYGQSDAYPPVDTNPNDFANHGCVGSSGSNWQCRNAGYPSSNTYCAGTAPGNVNGYCSDTRGDYNYGCTQHG
jgi:hypothetical protein